MLFDWRYYKGDDPELCGGTLYDLINASFN